jgi:SAM-dependent methyltransferase
MSENPNESPRPALRWPRYGVDAPPVPAVFAAAGVACCLVAARRRPGRIAMAAAGTVLLANAGVYLHTTLRGKLRIWERELDRAALQGNEQLLDLGCGRGAVLIAAARRLPAGRAVGADRWTRDQSGNSPEVTLANAAAAGVADRVEVHTADVTALPFPDGSFDIVTSPSVTERPARSVVSGQSGVARTQRSCGRYLSRAPRSTGSGTPVM